MNGGEALKSAGIVLGIGTGITAPVGTYVLFQYNDQADTVFHSSSKSNQAETIPQIATRPIVTTSVGINGEIVTQLRPQQLVQPQNVLEPKTVFIAPSSPSAKTEQPPKASAQAAVVAALPTPATKSSVESKPPAPAKASAPPSPSAPAQQVKDSKPPQNTQENKSPAPYILPKNPLSNYRQKYGLSCEVAAVKIALSYWQNGLEGQDLSEETLQNSLGQNEDPDLGFRGNYRATLSTVQDYGAHAPAVKRFIETYPKPDLFKAEPLQTIDDVKNAIRQNKPVLLWVTFALEPSYQQQISLSSGQKKSLVHDEHVVVATGFANGKIQIIDPEGEKNRSGFVEESLLAQRMSLFDHPALAVSPKS